MDANKQWPFLALLLVVIAAAQAATLPTGVTVRMENSTTPHTDDVMSSSITPHTDDAMSSSVTPHTDDVMSSSVIPHTDDAMSSSVTPHTDDAMSSSVTPHTDDVMSSSTTPHTDDAMSSSVAPHTDDAMSSSVTPHIDDVMSSSTTPHTDDAMSSSVTPHTDDAMSSSTTPHTDDAISSSVAPNADADRTSSSRTPDEEPEKTTHPLNNEGSLIFDQDKENKEAFDNGSGSTGDENNLVITLVSSLSSTIIAVITSCGVGFCCYRRRMRKCQHNAASSTQTTEMRDSTSTYNNCTFNTMVLPEAAKNWKHFNLPGIAAGLNRIKEIEC